MMISTSSLIALLWYYLCFLLSWRSVDGFVPPPAQGLLAASTFSNINVLDLLATKDGATENTIEAATTTTKRRKWEENYALLVEYYEKNGHANVPCLYKEEPKLGAWVGAQRKRRHSIKPDKRAKLDALNFTWDNERRKFEENYALLVEYYEEHGHANVPGRYKEDPKLGKWFENLRKRRQSLKPEKRAKLEALNITWDGVDKEKDNQRWEKMFLCLQEYKEKAGDCCVPVRYTPNPKLGNWVSTQRRHNTLGKIPSDRFHRLDSIGFVWRINAFSNRTSEIWEQKWEQKFNKLLEYRKENGDCRVPYLHKEENILGDWVMRQRVLNVQGELRPDRRARLDKIGFTWDFEEIRDEIWHNFYNQLMEIKEKKQNSKGTNDDRSNQQTWASPTRQTDVWSWELVQQHSFKRGTLNPQREALLAEIGYWSALDLARETK